MVKEGLFEEVKIELSIEGKGEASRNQEVEHSRQKECRYKGLRVRAELVCSKPEKKGQCGWSIEERGMVDS